MEEEEEEDEFQSWYSTGLKKLGQHKASPLSAADMKAAFDLQYRKLNMILVRIALRGVLACEVIWTSWATVVYERVCRA